MKIRTRIATAVSVALATLFISTPALAHDGHEHSVFSSAGEPVNVAAIVFVGVILFAVALLVGTWVGNLFHSSSDN